MNPGRIWLPTRQEEGRYHDLRSVIENGERLTQYGLPSIEGGAISTKPGPQQRQLIPFEKGTDPRFRKIAAPTFTIAGSDIRQDLPRTGLLSSVILYLTGTMNLSAASGLAALGPWNILKRIQVYTNTGTVSLWDTSGWGAFVQSFLQNESYGADRTGVTALYAAGVGSGNNTWNLILELPIAMNAGVDRKWGLINLQSPEVVATVQVTPGANTDAVTSIGTGTGFGSATLSIYYSYFEVPNPARYEMPPLAVHRVLESSQGISTTGDQVFTCPRQGTLLRLSKYFIVNSARPAPASANAPTTFSLRYNLTGLPMVEDEIIKLYKQRFRYGQTLQGAFPGVVTTSGFDLPSGTYVWDRWYAAELVGAGPLWDAIDTEAIAQLDFISTLPTGATVASGDRFGVVREFVQGLKRPQ
jgi:hypothetical protein